MLAEQVKRHGLLGVPLDTTTWVQARLAAVPGLTWKIVLAGLRVPSLACRVTVSAFTAVIETEAVPELKVADGGVDAVPPLGEVLSPDQAMGLVPVYPVAVLR